MSSFKKLHTLQINACKLSHLCFHLIYHLCLDMLKIRISLNCDSEEKIDLPCPPLLTKVYSQIQVYATCNLHSSAYPCFLTIRCFHFLSTFLPSSLLTCFFFFTYTNNQLHIVFKYKSVTGRKTASE